MKAIDYVVRTSMGAVGRSVIAADQTATRIEISQGDEVSLNVRQIDIQGYTRLGNDLEVVLVDGRVVVLENYFEANDDPARLFISADGYLNEVTFAEGSDGVLYGQYGPTEQWGKWSPSDDLIFVNESEVVSAATYAEENEVSMLAAGLLGGGGFGALGGAAAAAGGAALIGNLKNGGGSGGGNDGTPTVDDKPVIVGGDDQVAEGPSVPVTGTGTPGSKVTVNIGDKEQETTVDENGNWKTEFTGDDLPDDGTYKPDVTITDPDGKTTDLVGPEVVVDTTPPDLKFTEGTLSVDDLTNADDHADGVEIDGTGEPGASVVLKVGGKEFATTVGDDGTWSVTVDNETLGPGEYDADVEVITTDKYGNSASYSDTIVIDTVPNPLSIDTNGFEGDGTLNAVETKDGILVQGTSKAGETVTVTLGGQKQDVVVGSDGTWSAEFDKSTLDPGEYNAKVSVSSVDAAGNASSIDGTVQVDTFVRNFADKSTLGGSDSVVNGAEADSGLILKGTTEPGSTVKVQLGDTIVDATVDENGNWSAAIPGDQIKRGEYDADLTLTSTDEAGNVETLTDTVRIDTDGGSLTLSSDPIETDNVVNAQESKDGVLIHGTADPGAIVSVTWGGITHQAVADSTGKWQSLYGAKEVPPDTDAAKIYATTSDSAGNTLSVDGAVAVDTIVENHSIAPLEFGGDTTINATEQGNAVAISGTVEPGSSVVVTLGGVSQTATVDSDGNWVASFAAGSLPTGEKDLALVVNATDPHGNSDQLTDTVRLDTLVNNLDANNDPTGDGAINIAEASGGVTLTGVVEAGSTVMVAVGGMSYEATVASDGTWSVDVPPEAIPSTGDSLNVGISATDAAGNTANLNETYTLDLTAPDTPEVQGYFRGTAGYSEIRVGLTDTDVTVHEVSAGKVGSQIGGDGVENTTTNSETFSFDPVVPDGNHLIVRSEEGSGNYSSTYLALDETFTSAIDLSNPDMGKFNIESVDLQFAQDSQLTLDEAQVKALSSNTDTLVINGGGDDNVTLTGAKAAGTQTIDSQTYDVFHLGDAVVLVDDDITTNI